MAYPAKIDREALRLLILSGKTQAEIAKVFGANPRTVRENIAAARREHGAGWPTKPPAPRDKPPPSSPPSRRSAPQHPPDAPELKPPPPDASPDELEAYACAVYVAEAQCLGKDRIAAARALVELADKRRARKPRGDEPTVDPAEAAAVVMLEIERATANVENDVEADQEIDTHRSSSDGQGPRPPLQ